MTRLLGLFRWVKAVTGLPGRADTRLPESPDPAGEVRRSARRANPWLRREQDVVLPRLAALTDRTDPWTAAAHLFTNPPKEPTP